MKVKMLVSLFIPNNGPAVQGIDKELVIYNEETQEFEVEVESFDLYDVLLEIYKKVKANGEATGRLTKDSKIVIGGAVITAESLRAMGLIRMDDFEAEKEAMVKASMPDQEDTHTDEDDLDEESEDNDEDL